jgi:hypothetical protein
VPPFWHGLLAHLFVLVWRLVPVNPDQHLQLSPLTPPLYVPESFAHVGDTSCGTGHTVATRLFETRQ